MLIWGFKFGMAEIIWGLKFRGLKCASLISKIKVGQDYLRSDISMSPKMLSSV